MVQPMKNPMQQVLPSSSSAAVWANDAYLIERGGSTGQISRWIFSAVGVPKERPTGPEGVSQKLEYIAAAFELRVVRIARLLGVSRQAIYDWKQGKSLSEENHHKIEALYRAAQRFREASLEPDYNTRHCLIGGEVEFVDALAHNPLQAVERLIEVTSWGKKQGEWLAKLLGNRPEPSGSILDDLPPHYPGE